jgi:hypothetical protein
MNAEKVTEPQRLRQVPPKATAPNVYACIAAVSAKIAQTGIAKDRKNAQQGYSFRGIDDVYNALAPVLAEEKLVILPRILSRDCVERTSKSGSAQFFVTVAAEFDFVSAHDGSVHTVRTYGEAQDSGDKATNKAMSAAYKYAAFQTFCIPTEGDNDADAHTPDPVAPSTLTAAEVEADLAAARARGAHVSTLNDRGHPPPKYDEQWTDLCAAADEGKAKYDATWAAMPVEFKNYTMAHKKDERAALIIRAKAKP